MFISLGLLFKAIPAWGKIYIDVTQVSGSSFPIALVPPAQDGGNKDPENLNRRFVQYVQEDLELMGLFRFINESAFLEDPKKKAYQASDIDFASWALLDALALAKGWYRVQGKTITVEMRLFDVLAKTQLTAKRYEAGIDQIDWMAHRFANEIIRILTGENGVFNTKVAFIGRPERRGEKELFIMDFNGNNIKQLTWKKSMVLSPVWSHDGKTIFYTASEKKTNPQLYRYDLKQRTARRIKKLPGMTIGLAIHPITSLLATTLTKDGNAEIYLLTSNGSIRQRLTRNFDIDVSARFSPDGEKIVFVSNRKGSPQIYKMDINGQNVQRLTFKGKNNTEPSWSPKGDKILFVGRDTDGHSDIFSMDPDGSNMVRLTYDARNNMEPSWSPGGHLIAFSSNRRSRLNPRGKYQIWIMRPDGSRPKQLTQDSWDHHMPAWGPRS